MRMFNILPRVVDFCFCIFKRNGIAFDAIIIILEDRGNEMKSDVCVVYDTYIYLVKTENTRTQTHTHVTIYITKETVCASFYFEN